MVGVGGGGDGGAAGEHSPEQSLAVFLERHAVIGRRHLVLNDHEDVDDNAWGERDERLTRVLLRCGEAEALVAAFELCAADLTLSDLTAS